MGVWLTETSVSIGDTESKEAHAQKLEEQKQLRKKNLLKKKNLMRHKTKDKNAGTVCDRVNDNAVVERE